MYNWERHQAKCRRIVAFHENADIFVEATN
jgi:hypothetical protein